MNLLVQFKRVGTSRLQMLGKTAVGL